MALVGPDGHGWGIDPRTGRPAILFENGNKITEAGRASVTELFIDCKKLEVEDEQIKEAFEKLKIAFIKISSMLANGEIMKMVEAKSQIEEISETIQYLQGIEVLNADFRKDLDFWKNLIYSIQVNGTSSKNDSIGSECENYINNQHLFVLENKYNSELQRLEEIKKLKETNPYTYPIQSKEFKLSLLKIVQYININFKDNENFDSIKKNFEELLDLSINSLK